MAAQVVPVVDWAGRRQSVWSQTADRLKASPSRLRVLLLGLTVVAAALALAGSRVKSVSLSGLGGAG